MLETIRQLKNATDKLFDSNAVIGMTASSKDEVRIQVYNIDVFAELAEDSQSKIKIKFRFPKTKDDLTAFPWRMVTVAQGVQVICLMEYQEMLDYAQSSKYGSDVALQTINRAINENRPSDVGASTEALSENMSV